MIHRLGSLAGWSDPRGGADLIGDRHGLLYLAEFVGADVSKEMLALDEVKQRVPEEVPLRLIEVSTTSGLVQVSIEGESLRISGSRGLRSLLAQHVASVSEGDPTQTIQHHTHIEYWPDHDFLDPSAEPLVVTLART